MYALYVKCLGCSLISTNGPQFPCNVRWYAAMLPLPLWQEKRNHMISWGNGEGSIQLGKWWVFGIFLIYLKPTSSTMLNWDIQGEGQTCEPNPTMLAQVLRCGMSGLCCSLSSEQISNSMWQTLLQIIAQLDFMLAAAYSNTVCVYIYITLLIYFYMMRLTSMQNI